MALRKNLRCFGNRDSARTLWLQPFRSCKRKASVVVAGEMVIEAARWKKVRQRAADAIDARHRAHAEQAGLPLTDLRTALESDTPVAEMFDAIVADLCAP